jgi:hypothetical protein
MESKGTRATNAELERVASQYMEQFGHPPQKYCKPLHSWHQLTGEISLQLMQKALETGEPVPTWAEQHSGNQAIRKLNGAISVY